MFLFIRRVIPKVHAPDLRCADQEEAAWMIPPRPPAPSAGAPGRCGAGAANDGRIAPPAPSLEAAGSALAVAPMTWLGRDDTYRTSWRRNEGEGDAIAD